MDDADDVQKRVDLGRLEALEFRRLELEDEINTLHNEAETIRQRMKQQTAPLREELSNLELEVDAIRLRWFPRLTIGG